MKKPSEQIKANIKTGERLKNKMNSPFYSKIVDSVIQEHNQALKRLITIKNDN